MKPRYDRDFYSYTQRRSLASAEVVVPILAAGMTVRSVLDVGCGTGAWIRTWIDLGVDDVLGVDGLEVEEKSLLVPPDRFFKRDLARGLELDRRFDLVQCIEVAEHLSSDAGEDLIASLCRHGDVVLFSAAAPGQGGEGHVNERPPEYWRRVFSSHDFGAFDPLRPALRGRRDLPSWHRFNLLLYASERGASQLARPVLDTEVPEELPIPSFESPAHRIRRSLLRWLPPAAVTRLAAAARRWTARSDSGS